MKRKIHLRTKNKLKIRNQLKLVYTGIALLAFLVGGWVIYLNFSNSKEGYSNDQAPQLDFNWKRKIQLTNQLSQGEEILTDFPLLIHIQDSEFRSINYGGKVVHPKGYDIRFSKTDESSMLPSQIDSYNPQTGELSVWVLIDTLSAKKNNELTILYSNATIRSELSSVLWNGIYRGIWHMNNLHASNDRKLVATSFGTNEFDGVIGKARLFESSRNDAAYFAYSNELDLTKEFSFSAWIKLNELGREQVVFSNEDGISGGYKFYITQNNKLDIEYINVSGKRISVSQSTGGEYLEKNRWYYIAGSYSTKKNKLITYVNGKLDRESLVFEAANNSTRGLQIGRDLNNNNSYFNGFIDEIRISSHVFNPNRFAAEFKNQTAGKQLFKLMNSEKIELALSSVKRNKEGMNEIAAKNSSNQETENNLHAKKLYVSNQAPGSLTSSIEALQSRMNYIRRVSNENFK